MSDLLFNLRIWCVHFQVRIGWQPLVSFNRYHWPKPQGAFVELYR